MEILGLEVVVTETNCCIKNSHLVISKIKMLEVISEVLLKFPEFTKRSARSYLREWRAHNWLYNHNLFVASTKDSDLSIYEPLFRRIVYFFISLIYLEK